MHNIRINRTIDELMIDIRSTRDPVQKTILKKFLQIKIYQAQNVNNANDTNMSDDISDHLSDLDIDNNTDILEDQDKSLRRLEKLSEIKAYEKLLEENKREESNNIVKKTRGKSEMQKWGTNDLYDPKYSKYVEEDQMNNKLMERLNTEIDFRLSDNPKSRTNIIKPFDDADDMDSIGGDGYAKSLVKSFSDPSSKSIKSRPNTRPNKSRRN